MGAQTPYTGRPFYMSADATRFLMIKRDPAELANPALTGEDPQFRASEAGYVVVRNWLEELKRLAPAD